MTEKKRTEKSEKEEIDQKLMTEKKNKKIKTKGKMNAN